MTLKRSFAAYMESLGFGTFGTNLFLNGAPLNAPDACWWILATGGAIVETNQTGEKLKNYIVSVYYRNTDAETVDQSLHDFEELLNTTNCDQLEGFNTIDVSVTTFPADQDLDIEDRTVGLAQVTIQTYL